MLLVAAFTLSMTGCKKEKTTGQPQPATTNIQDLSNDEQNVEQASDDILKDAADLISGGSLKSTAKVVCNLVVDSMSVANDSVTFYATYNGLNCNHSFSRTGHMTIRHRVGEQWHEAGTTIIYKIIDLHIIKVSNGFTMTMNGTKFRKNVNGMFNPELTVVIKEWGTVQTVFGDNTTTTWHNARIISRSDSTGDVSVEGFGVSEGYDSLSEWGVHRNGKIFYSQILQAVVHKEICNRRPYSGKIFHIIPAESKSALITFGFDNNNQPVTSGCPTRYRLDWVNGSLSGTFFLPMP